MSNNKLLFNHAIRTYYDPRPSSLRSFGREMAGGAAETADSDLAFFLNPEPSLPEIQYCEEVDGVLNGDSKHYLKMKKWTPDMRITKLQHAQLVANFEKKLVDFLRKDMKTMKGGGEGVDNDDNVLESRTSLGRDEPGTSSGRAGLGLGPPLARTESRTLGGIDSGHDAATLADIHRIVKSMAPTPCRKPADVKCCNLTLQKIIELFNESGKEVMGGDWRNVDDNSDLVGPTYQNYFEDLIPHTDQVFKTYLSNIEEGTRPIEGWNRILSSASFKQAEKLLEKLHSNVRIVTTPEISMKRNNGDRSLKFWSYTNLAKRYTEYSKVLSAIIESDDYTKLYRIYSGYTPIIHDKPNPTHGEQYVSLRSLREQMNGLNPKNMPSSDPAARMENLINRLLVFMASSGFGYGHHGGGFDIDNSDWDDEDVHAGIRAAGIGGTIGGTVGGTMAGGATAGGATAGGWPGHNSLQRFNSAALVLRQHLDRVNAALRARGQEIAEPSYSQILLYLDKIRTMEIRAIQLLQQLTTRGAFDSIVKSVQNGGSENDIVLLAGKYSRMVGRGIELIEQIESKGGKSM